MSDLSAVLRSALATARKAQDRERVLVLSTILANIENRRIELARALSDEDAAEVVRKGIKLRREAAEQFEGAGRSELAAAERKQIAILEEYLPAAADPAELRAAVRAAIAGGATDIGKVMSLVMPQFRGRADGRTINQIAREELQAR